MSDQQLATTTDLSDSLGRSLSSDEETRGPRRLATAQSMLNQRVNYQLVARTKLASDDPSYIDPEIAAEVISGIVARQWRNINGVTSWQKGVGPFTRSESFRDQDSPGELYVSDEDLARLLGADDSYSSAGTIRLAPARFPFSCPSE
jgi:hypothetical protein